MCGENIVKNRRLFEKRGSLPRMRGKPATLNLLAGGTGITPAHAGKTYPAGRQGLSVSDHLRACGENAHQLNRCRTKDGSPPRMRGKPFLVGIEIQPLRITPAHAGKTPFSCSCRSLCADHPRACGENEKHGLDVQCLCGSPPRMRGKHARHAHPVALPRITPAHAGKTLMCAPFMWRCADHPRACGENLTATLALFLPDGSPPRMRGKLRAVRAAVVLRRITPAHAGKTR